MLNLANTCPPDSKTWLFRKDPDAGKDWRQENGTTEDEMVGWYHQLNGHEFDQALGDGEGQQSLACYSPWGCKGSEMTEWMNNKKGLWEQFLHDQMSIQLVFLNSFFFFKLQNFLQKQLNVPLFSAIRCNKG